MRPLLRARSTDAERISDRVGGRAVGAEAGAEVGGEALRGICDRSVSSTTSVRLAMVGEADRGAVIHEVEVGADADAAEPVTESPSLSTTVSLRVSVIEPSVRLMMWSVNGAPVGDGSAV